MKRSKSNLASTASLAVVVFISVLFLYLLPEFLLSAKGKIFTAAWFCTAALIASAHLLNLLDKSRRPAIIPEFKRQRIQIAIKDARTRKNIRSMRATDN